MAGGKSRSVGTTAVGVDGLFHRRLTRAGPWLHVLDLEVVPPPRLQGDRGARVDAAVAEAVDHRLAVDQQPRAVVGAGANVNGSDTVGSSCAAQRAENVVRRMAGSARPR